MCDKLREAFSGIAAGEPHMLFAPGRVNLMGDHIDYNGGRVMPMSLAVGTYCAAAIRNDGRAVLMSLDFPNDVMETAVADIPASRVRGWAAYPVGVAAKLMEDGHAIGGFTLVVAGNMPKASGLSSSASLEVLTCAALDRLFGLGIDGVSAALICRRAENEYVGMSCGIMDQFACAMGRKDHAILLDTDTLEYEYIPYRLKGVTTLLLNTRFPRELISSAYNTRRTECEEAARRLGVDALCSLSSAEFEGISGRIGDDTLLRRARHAVTENERTFLAAAAMRAGDAAELGRIMNASHDSLRTDYEVSGAALDIIVDATCRQKGVLGARMTGAGFGGCAVALVEDAFVSEVTNAVRSEYLARTGRECDVIAAASANSPFGA